MINSSFYRAGLLSCAIFLVACSNDDDRPLADFTHSDEHQAFVLMSQQADNKIVVFNQVDESFSEFMHMSENGAKFSRSKHNTSALITVAGEYSFVALADDHHDVDEVDADDDHSADLHLDISDFQTQAIAHASSGGVFSLLLPNQTVGILDSESVHEANDFDAIFDLVVQNYPLVMIEEAEAHALVFSSGQSTIYQSQSADFISTNQQQLCANPSQLVQAEALIVMQCDEGLEFLYTESHDGVLEFTFGSVNIDELNAPESVQWQAVGHSIIGFISASDQIFQLHIEENAMGLEVHAESLVLLNNEMIFDFTQTICGIAENTGNEEELFIVTEEAGAWVFSTSSYDSDSDGHEDEHTSENFQLISQLQLDDSPSQLQCDDLRWSGASNTFFIADNKHELLYTILAHEGPYHIERRDSMIFSIADITVLHEFDAHDHEK